MPQEGCVAEDTDKVSRGAAGPPGAARAVNARRVLAVLQRAGPLSRAELARRTGLSAQAVSVIMRGLEEEGLIARGNPMRGRIGQPSVPMGLAPEGALFLGLKIGRRSAEMALVDFLGHIRDRRRTHYAHPEPDAIRSFARLAMDVLLAPLPTPLRTRVAGLGIAMPFRLWEWTRPLGLAPGAMDDWKTRDIRADLAGDCAFPVFLQNDATAACGAELIFADGPVPRDFLYFYIGHFVGGGLVLDGSLHVGRTGNAASLGPMPVPGAPGRQLVDVASLHGLEARLGRATPAAEMIWTRHEGWDLPEAVLADWRAEAADGLAHAIVSVASIVEIGEVRIDGWLPRSLIGALAGDTRAALGRLNTAGIGRLPVVQGSVGADARVLGAAALPLAAGFMATPAEDSPPR